MLDWRASRRASQPQHARLIWLAGQAAWALALALGGCDPITTSTQLINLDTVEQSDDRERALYLRGSGFPTGRSCELVWEGFAYGPGLTRRALSARTPCRALSDFRLVSPLETEGFEAGVQSGIFEGRLQVVFAGDAHGRKVTGTLERARVRLMDRTQSGPLQELAQARQARAFQRSLGMLEVEAGEGGVTLTRLDPNGAAARAGCVEGDLVARANGAPLERPSDFLIAAAPADLRLLILSRGQGLPREVTIAASSRATHAQGALVLLFAALSLLAGLLLPTPARLGKWRAPTTNQGGLWSCCGLLVAASLGLTGALDVRALWLLPLAARVAWLLFAHARRGLALKHVLDECILLGVATLGVTALGVAQGSLTTALAPFERTLPWQWALFTLPSTWFAMVVLSGREPVQPVSALDAHSQKLVQAGKLVMLVGFGMGAGSQPLVAPGSLAASLWSVGVLALKLPFAAILLRAAYQPLSRLTRGALALAAPVVALLSARAFPAEASHTVLLGTSACGLILGVLLHWVAARARSRSVTPRDPALAPFL